MTRTAPAALAFVALAFAGTGAVAQGTVPPLDPPGKPAEDPGIVQSIEQFDAAEYIRGLLANDPYDPRIRERALNGAGPATGPYWRSTIFDGRRTRSTYGTGLRIPFPTGGTGE